MLSFFDRFRWYDYFGEPAASRGSSADCDANLQWHYYAVVTALTHFENAIIFNIH